MITAGTRDKQPLLESSPHRDLVQTTILETLDGVRGIPHAWAVLPNHYHLIAELPENAGLTLSELVRQIHSITARELNALDGITGRKVWFQFWDTCLTHQTSYLARLKYVHTNPVKHGLVQNAEDYPWCSVRWFLRTTSPSHQRTVLAVPCERVNVRDDYD